MQQDYENGHKKVLGIWFNLVLKVKYSTIANFKVIFLCRSQQNLYIFFSLKNTKMGGQLLSLTYFDNFDFQCTSFSKNTPKF